MSSAPPSESPSPIEHAVQLAGSQSELARRIGSTQGSVWRWLNGTPVPPEAVLRIEAEFGIPKERLRPDIYPPAASSPAAGVDPLTGLEPAR